MSKYALMTSNNEYIKKCDVTSDLTANVYFIWDLLQEKVGVRDAILPADGFELLFYGYFFHVLSDCLCL